MKIIKNGRVNADKPKRYTCTPGCESVIEVSRDEMDRKSDQRDGDYYLFRCPVCAKDVYIAASVVER